MGNILEQEHIIIHVTKQSLVDTLLSSVSPSVTVADIKALQTGEPGFIEVILNSVTTQNGALIKSRIFSFTKDDFASECLADIEDCTGKDISIVQVDTVDSSLIHVELNIRNKGVY